MTAFKAFKVDELFDVSGTKSVDAGSLTFSEQGVNFIGRTNTNNGIQGKIDAGILDYEANVGNTITISQVGTMVALYQQQPYYTSQNIAKLTLNNHVLNRRLGLFFTTILNKQLIPFVGYNTPKLQDIKDFIIELPVTPDGTPDFEYMEAYIKEIEQKHIKKLESDLATRTESLLTVIGREDLVGDPDGLAAVVDKGFDDSGVEYAEFHLNDLFTGDDITKGRRIKQSDREPGDIMLITAGMENYGVSGYIKDHIAHCDGDCMTIDMFGNVFYRPDEFFFDDNIVVYKNKRYDRYTYMYLVSALGHLVNRFGYGNQFRASKADDVVLTLPITEAGTPDFDFMAQYIAHIELKYTHTDAMVESERIAIAKELVE